MPSPAAVSTYRKIVELPTHLPLPPDSNPMFLEKRVYQGSSGRVYPLPFTDRIAEKPRLRRWSAIFIENEYLQVMILPELGGRIHRVLDKTNGYDAVYYQPVIKPALVGLAGPWASGGIEFNWPQHHRPSTFMPADVSIERHPDGSATVWLSEHDPMARMKGTHGVRLHPGRSCLELVARVYNRTPDPQTFLWWANVATRVHEHYQSFFPPDATHVADHAKRATDTYPLSSARYYGIDYASRGRTGIPAAEIPRHHIPPHCLPKLGSPTTHNPQPITAGHPAYRPDDLSWYANIPVPTSYMCTASDEDFAGGYDHRARAGLISVANHHISPGKKQWTWGNHEFGYAWDRNLTEPDANGAYAPYIELMVGVYTDNQPDFAHLQPGETKTWSQYWYPFREIGPAQQANVEAALSLQVQRNRARIGVAVTARHPGATIRLQRAGKTLRTWRRSLAPDAPFNTEVMLPPSTRDTSLSLRVSDADDRELIRYAPKPKIERAAPAPAVEPPLPSKVVNSDELIVIGQHLEQYRHATRSPVAYWQEALRRDSGDCRAHLALGRWHLHRREFAIAESHLRASIARLTSLNPNPADGEAYYQLGLCLVQAAFADPDQSSRLIDAYTAFYKATWNQAWQSAGYHALAELDARRDDWSTALDHLTRSLQLNTDNLRARNLRVIALRRLGRHREAAAFVRATLTLDPLDWWALHLAGSPRLGAPAGPNVQVLLDLAHDHARAGLYAEALALLANARPVGRIRDDALPDASLGTAPLLHYTRAWLCHQLGRTLAARRYLAAAAKASPDYCFPARLEEIAILNHAIAGNARDARAPFYLANLYYDRRRHEEAISLWERAVRLEPRNATAWRNLGIGYYNIQHDTKRARRAYDTAFRTRQHDARILFERDQLWKRLAVSPAHRRHELQQHPDLVDQRDDLSLELCSLFNHTHAPQLALPILTTRKFQPWEGGEGQVLGQFVRTYLLLGRRALVKGDATKAAGLFKSALNAPENLGEAGHLLANQSDIHYWLGCALAAAGNAAGAGRHWLFAAEFKGDFQTMSIRPYSEMTYYSALALQQLGRKGEARRLLRGLLAYARSLGRMAGKIDYFATSLPTMLLFEDDLDARQQTTARCLEAQARLALGETAAAHRLLRTVLRHDPNHSLATDLLA